MLGKAIIWGVELQDEILYDGLIDAFQIYHMGITVENSAEKYFFLLP